MKPLEQLLEHRKIITNAMIQAKNLTYVTEFRYALEDFDKVYGEFIKEQIKKNDG